MKNILVLVDFTETADISMKQAIELAKARSATLHVSHIFPHNRESEGEYLKRELDRYKAMANEADVDYRLELAFGELAQGANDLIEKHRIDLVVVGTHGMSGIKQNLFGSNIYNLVRKIPVPALVVNDNTTVAQGGFHKVMLPISSHPDFALKVNQTCELLANDAVVTIFAIVKPGVPFDEQTKENIENAKTELDRRNVQWQFQEVESTKYSVGYSHETLDNLKGQDMDLISIMTEVSDSSQHFGKIDKENVLLNEQGLPVLCAH